MSFLHDLARPREGRSVGGDWEKWAKYLVNQFRAASGAVVTDAASMKLVVYYACTRILSEDTAKLPLCLFRRLTPRGKTRATEDPRYHLVHDSPNPYQTSFELRETLMGHVVGRGDGYLYRQYDGFGRLIALYNLRPDRITLRVLEGRDPARPRLIFWEYTLPNGEVRVLYEDQVIHFRGFGFDGWQGYSTVEQARTTLGLVAAAEGHASSFFANDATPRTVLKHKKSFKKPGAAEAIRKSWEERLRGFDKSHLLAILEDDMDLETIGIDPQVAQLLETREFNVEEVCRWFRMPPHKVGALRKATYSNIEHQSLEYVVDTLTPPLCRVEQRLTAALLTEEERRELFFEHVLQGLVRGDFASRMQGYRVGREISLYSTNDLLELENMNPIGPEGDVRHVPLNWVPLTAPAPQDSNQPDPGQGDTPQNPPTPDSSAADARTAQLLLRMEATRSAGLERAAELRLRLRDQFRPLYTAAAEDITARELADVDRAVRRHLKREDLAGLREWVVGFFAAHDAYISRKLAAATAAYATAVADVVDEHLGGELAQRDALQTFAADYLAGPNGRGAYYASAGRGAVLAIINLGVRNEDSPADAIHDALVELAATRAASIASTETVRAGEALAHAAYEGATQVAAWVWRRRGETCQHAAALDGLERPAGEPFLVAGQRLATDDSNTLEPGQDIHHAPAHRGCDCYTEPVLGGTP